MAGTDTFIFRAALQDRASIYRDIELDPAKSLSMLAEAIVSSFDFDFDHAFGFYAGLTPAKMHETFPKYELFADLGDADPRVLGVRKTRISQASPKLGTRCCFCSTTGTTGSSGSPCAQSERRAPRPGTRASSQRVVRLLRNTPTMMTTQTRFGINPLTDEKIWFKK
jgi:hypothetical protein